MSILLALALATASLPVLALGLGQIKVLSRSGQPLVAEIPVISTDPAELQQLQARLASPDTFRRIGLEPPQGAVANLRFAVALDAQGNPVVRVTSPVPIEQPLLTFLLEVDWGQGRLVREYSVLVDAPESAVAIGQPPIQAPQPPPPSTVVRPNQEVQPVAATPGVQTEALPPDPGTEPAPVVAQPAPPPAAPPAPPPTPPPAPAASATPGEYGPVQRGQTLSGIASGLGMDDYSLNQTMLALLRTNPEAFIDGNINLLREGAVLRMPERDVLAELSPSEANAVVRAQVRSWRERNAPPIVAAEAVAGAATDAPADTANAGGDTAAGDSVSAADARLEIVPPAGEGGQVPGSRSGLSAGGEGDMLRNDLRQAKEDLAARDAEVEELRARLAEVEELQQKQAQLLDLKDSELASVQRQLAENRTAGADAAAAEATVAQPVRDATPVPLPWLLGGLALLLVAAGAWWWQRRRRPAVPVAPMPAPRRNYDTAALAAGLTGTASGETGTKPATPAPTVQAPRAAPPPRAMPASPADASVGPAAKPVAQAPAPVAPAAPMPAAALDIPPPPPPPPPPPVDEAAPTWHAGAVPVVADAPAGPGVPLEAKGQASPAGRDGLELARAYLDLGDHQAARTLLREVLLGRDPGAREEAARMLRELG
ncbi:MAG TPA: FimV/HubP family polar landmark protein [Xanthomonadaceae bacterium]|nr:FimV/HubP family polar landmark protein [Xanthomonadaceae bacterium]